MPSKVSDTHPGPLGEQPGTVVALTDKQFSELVELLKPGYELAKLMLAQHRDLLAERDAALAAQQGENKTEEG